MYVDFNAGNKEYKLRLNIGSIMALEKKIGVNPAAVFGLDETKPEIPTITTMVAILWASMQDAHHGITLADAQNIFQEWIDDGNTPTDFIKTIMAVYKASGIFKADKTEKN